jgi:hypothetical protein
MKFIKGKSGNPTGRPVGSKNKKSEQLRQFLTDMFYKDRKTLLEYYSGLGTKERWRVFGEFAPYVVPRLSSTEVTSDYTKLSDEDLDKLFDKIMKSAIKAA